ncbi:MAG: ribbon-helix-helix domain-containing protein [Devosia sp.]
MPQLTKRSVALKGHPTSVALEDDFWAALDRWAKTDHISVPVLISRIDETRQEGSLASAIRVQILKHVQDGRAVN